jgi:hypothetical protein
VSRHEARIVVADVAPADQTRQLAGFHPVGRSCTQSVPSGEKTAVLGVLTGAVQPARLRTSPVLTVSSYRPPEPV